MVNFGNPTCPETRLKHNVFNDLVSFGKVQTLNPETNALSMLSYGRMKGRFRSLAESRWAVDLELESKECPSRHGTARRFFSEEGWASPRFICNTGVTQELTAGDNLQATNQRASAIRQPGPRTAPL